MKTTAFVSHSDCSLHDTGWNHPEHQGRLPALMRAVYRDMLTLFDPLLEVEGRHASEAELLRAHSGSWLAKVREAVAEAGRQGRPVELGGGSMVSAATWDAATAAAGSVLTGIDAVLTGEVRNAFCAVRPPGGQVGRGGGGDFGVFNNVAVGALELLGRPGIERLLAVVWGGRPAGGTAEILGAEPRVRFASVVEAGEAEDSPGASRKLPREARGGEYVEALSDVLSEATDGFAPDFVLLAAGFDALGDDPLGGLALEPRDYHRATEVMRGIADAHCDGRLVSVLEGGYHPAATGAAVVQHLRALATLPPA